MKHLLKAIQKGRTFSRAVVPAIRQYPVRMAIPMNKSESPLFRFGVIADIQYADIDDAANFGGTEHRYYRASLQEAAKAVKSWNEVNDPPVRFVAQLGDLIDGQNAGEYGAGLEFPEPQSEKAIALVLNELNRAKDHIQYFHAIGNHELYNFNWEKLNELLNEPGRHKVSDPDNGKFYYSFIPHVGWRVIMLNPYEVSVNQSEEYEGYHEAVSLLKKHNPNDVLSGKGNVNYFANMEGEALRFVPFNGGASNEQIDWLRREVQHAKVSREKVIVLSHLPLHHRSASYRNIAYNSPEILEILETEGQDVVVMVLSGHAHRGGFHSAGEHGIHHITVESPLSNGESHGVVEVYRDRVEIKGTGALPSRVLRFKSAL